MTIDSLYARAYFMYKTKFDYKEYYERKIKRC